MAETSSLVVEDKLLKLPDHSELVTTPLISIQTYLVFPERNNSVDETTGDMSILPTEQTSCSLIDLVAVTHSQILVRSAKSKLVVRLITSHCEEPMKRT